MNKRVLMSSIVGVIFLVLSGLTIQDYVQTGALSISSAVSLTLCATAFLHALTWGNDQKSERDELGKMITNKSGAISYQLLTFSLFVMYIADRIVFVRRDEWGNVTLLVALMFAMVLQPLVTYFVSKKYR